MKWLKRGLWLAAWGAWAWLGWGLSRELPRDLGPPVCTLSIGDETVLGFLPGKDIAVSQKHAPAPDPFRFWDAKTGALLTVTLDETDETFLKRSALRQPIDSSAVSSAQTAEIEKLDAESKRSPDGRWVADWTRQTLIEVETRRPVANPMCGFSFGKQFVE